MADGRRVIKVRWVAVDEHFVSRPISLHYRRAGDETWTLLVSQLSNSGRYDWRVPRELEGPVEVKVSACDRAGNRVEKSGLSSGTVVGEEDASDVSGMEGEFEGAPNGKPGAGDSASLGKSADGWPGADAVRRADELFGKGQWHFERGEYLLAAQRWREALEIDPQHARARTSLGHVLFKQGKYPSARREFEAVLGDFPAEVEALRGMGLTMAALGDYSSAGKYLESLLERSPEDADAWLRLGDVALMMGDRSKAQASWSQAGQVEEANPQVVAQAQRRLKLYP
jgi:thioredoxin-like negative regulator of GroEL